MDTIKQKKYKHTKEYDSWKAMIRRCTCEKEKQRYLTYLDCECCEDWFDFNKFNMWIHEQQNYTTLIDLQINWHLDKDILVKGNKIYSPETCCIVPHNVNLLFTKTNKNRGLYPIGVSIASNGISFRVRYNDHGKQITVNGFNTPEEAFEYYKINKEKVIKQVANESYENGLITFNCYNAMMNYEVEIMD